MAKEAATKQRGEKRYSEAFQEDLDEYEQLIILTKRSRMEALEKQRQEEEAEAIRQQNRLLRSRLVLPALLKST